MSSSGDRFQTIVEGARHSHEYLLSSIVYRVFLDVFGDTNPIHVNLDYAKAAGFDQLVMHGAILNGFLSHFIGVEFPGEGALIMSVRINYVKPCFLNDTIRLEAEVTHKLDSRRVIEMSVIFSCLNRSLIIARANVTVALSQTQS